MEEVPLYPAYRIDPIGAFLKTYGAEVDIVNAFCYNNYRYHKTNVKGIRV